MDYLHLYFDQPEELTALGAHSILILVKFLETYSTSSSGYFHFQAINPQPNHVPKLLLIMESSVIFVYPRNHRIIMT